MMRADIWRTGHGSFLGRPGEEGDQLELVPVEEEESSTSSDPLLERALELGRRVDRLDKTLDSIEAGLEARRSSVT